MSTITITPAALRAALATTRRMGADRDNDGEAAAFFIDALNVLEALLDPAHQMDGAASITAAAVTPAATAPAEPARPPAETSAPRAPDALSVETLHSLAIGPAPTLAQEESQPAHADSIAAAEADHAPGDAAAAPPLLRGIARAPSGGGAPRAVWPDARIARLDAGWREHESTEAFLAELNAIPADQPIASVGALRAKARERGLRRSQAMLDAIARASGQKGGAVTEARTPTVETGMRTPERIALLRRMWPDQALSIRQIHEAWNALPGPTFESGNSLYGIARMLGLPSQRMAIAAAPPAAPAAEDPPIAIPPAPGRPEPEPAPTADHFPETTKMVGAPTAPPIDARIAKAWAGTPGKGATLPVSAARGDDIKAEAFEAFDRGLTVRDIAVDFGEPIATLSTWQAEWRLLRKQQEQGASNE